MEDTSPVSVSNGSTRLFDFSDEDELSNVDVDNDDDNEALVAEEGKTEEYAGQSLLGSTSEGLTTQDTASMVGMVEGSLCRCERLVGSRFLRLEDDEWLESVRDAFLVLLPMRSVDPDDLAPSLPPPCELIASSKILRRS